MSKLNTMPTPNITEQNAGVKSWFDTTFRLIKMRYMELVQSKDRSGEGLDTLRMRTRQSYGEIDSGSLNFKRYLVWVHKGAGRGQGGSKGSKWIGPDGQLKKTNPLSFGKMNSGTRHAEEWLNPVLDEQVPKLANIVAGFKADAAIKQIQIK